MTRLLEYVREAFDALLRNKARSILTMFGMLIGVAAVNSVYGLSSGAAAGIAASVNNTNFPTLTVKPDPQQADPSIAQLQFRDAQILASGGGAIRRVVPFYQPFSGIRARVVHLKYGSIKVNGFPYSWYGDDPDLKVLAGRAISGADVDGASRVTLISHDLAVHFYKSDEASLGEFLIVNGTRLQIVGVVDDNQGTGQNYFGGSYYFVVPYTTYHNMTPGPVDGVMVWALTPNDEAAARDEVLSLLAHSHGATAKYTVQSTKDQIAQTEKVLDIIAISLTAIGAISLFVAGIGIMNIMLVSVSERTREIGIRKSIGAKSGDIVLQFLIEATLLSLIGGFIGLLLSFVVILPVSGAMSRFTGPPAIPYANVIASGFIFSLVVGVVFGVYPALRASRLDPVEALRS
jgi:putative ABC transport system permease protein